MQAAPAAPIQATDVSVMTIDPSAAPREKPRYMKEALRERATGVLAGPAMPTSRACWGGKNAQALRPQRATSGRIGVSALGVQTSAASVRPAKLIANTGKATAWTRR